MKTAKEQLIEELKMLVINEWNSEMNIHCPNYEKIADFVIAKNKNIVEVVKASIPYLNDDDGCDCGRCLTFKELRKIAEL